MSKNINLIKCFTLIFVFIPILCFSQWTQVGEDIDGDPSGSNFGRETAINDDGSIVAVAGSDVRIYENIGGVWTQIGNEIIDVGSCLSINNNGLIVASGRTLYGTTGVPSRGRVKVFEYVNGNWAQIGDDILGLNANDQLGEAVSLSGDGNIVAVGANFNAIGNPPFSGYVNIYENINDAWTQIGSTIYGEDTGDLSGTSISLNDAGNIVAIGAPNNEGNNNPNSGHVRVYENIGGVWTQIGADIDGEASMDGFGVSVSLNNEGNILAVGADSNAGVNGTFSGHVRVFENVGGSWVQLGNDIDGEASQDFFGVSVSLNGTGNLLAVGAPLNDANGNGIDFGHARIFEYQNNDWVQVGEDIDGEAANDGSGVSVSMTDDGSTLAIGANFNDGSGNNTGHVRVYNNPSILSTENFDLVNQIRLYPNPSRGNLFVELGQTYEKVRLDIYNNLGAIVNSYNYINIKKIKIDNQNQFSTGIYFVQIYTKESNTSIKFIVE